MRCPIDDVDLVMSERSGIEIDYCPKCRGVWLDRGELDKIIEKSASDNGQSAPVERAQPRPTRDDYHPHENFDHKYKKRKRESFLGDLFDF